MEFYDVLRKINVLAVDDQPNNLVTLEAVLSKDCNLITSVSGEEALSILLSRNDIDVILLDIQMPLMDGYETAKKIKWIPGYSDLPIIFITAVFREEPFVRRGYEVGGVDYFTKPFDPEILRMKVAIYGSFRQKTDLLKEREKRVHETEELLRLGKRLSSALENLPVGVMIADRDGRVIQTNGHVSRKGEMIRRSIEPVARAITEGKTLQNVLIEIDGLEGTKLVLCSTSPLLSIDEQVLGAVVVLQDITESKQIEKDLMNRISGLGAAS
jgi:response regulator RpfG family c-di-GMP phosphodiesterase